jgi:hypothetical protein
MANPDHADRSTRELLRRAAPGDVEASAVLDSVRLTADRRRTRGRATRSTVAFLVAASSAALVFLAGVAVGNGGEASTLSVGSSSVTNVAADLGGTLLEGFEGSNSATIDSGTSSKTVDLPSPLTPATRLSPDGTQLAVWIAGGAQKGFAVVSGDGTVNSVTGSAAGVGDAIWSPDGQSLAFETCASWPSCEVKTASASGAVSTETVASSGRGIGWAPDSSSIAYVDPNGFLADWELASGKSVNLASANELANQAGLNADAQVALVEPAWSPSGNHIAATLDDGEGFVPIVVDRGGVLVAVGNRGTKSAPDLAWAAVDEKLFFAEGPKESGFQTAFASSLYAMGEPNWQPSTILSVNGEADAGLFPSPDGSAIVWQTSKADVATGHAGDVWWNQINVTSETLSQRTEASIPLLDWR